MEGLSEQQRVNNFDIAIFAKDSEYGVIGCIAGLCGLDPWFQERGFITDVEANRVSISPHTFFGAEDPFYQSGYHEPLPITVDHAIVALRRAIVARTGEVSPSSANEERSSDTD
jgi:hypothetical protein